MTKNKFPNNWCVVSLGDIITPIKGRKPKTLGEKNNKFITPYITIKTFEKNIFENFTDDVICPRCNEHDILIVWDGARSGLVGTGVSGVIGSTLAKLVCYDINPKYLYYFLQKHYETINKNTKGIGIPHVNPTILWNLEFPIPPLNEQKNIVTKIDNLFSLVTSTLELLEEIKIKVDQYRISLFKSLFFGDYRNFFSLSSNWKEGTIGTFFEIIGGGTPSTKNPKYWGGKTPWITSADIYDIKNIIPRRTVTQIGITNSSTHIIPKNSILVVTRVGLGKLAILEQDMCINQDIQALIARNSEIYPFFALHYLSEMVKNLKYQSRGTTIAGVTKKQLSEIPFLFPPLNEQKNIVEFIEKQLFQLSHIRQILEKNNSILNSMKDSILNQAFEGKLVPQNIKDEPASLLLERIKKKKKL